MYASVRKDELAAERGRPQGLSRARRAGQASLARGRVSLGPPGRPPGERLASSGAASPRARSRPAPSPIPRPPPSRSSAGAGSQGADADVAAGSCHWRPESPGTAAMSHRRPADHPAALSPGGQRGRARRRRRAGAGHCRRALRERPGRRVRRTGPAGCCPRAPGAGSALGCHWAAVSAGCHCAAGCQASVLARRRPVGVVALRLGPRGLAPAADPSSGLGVQRLPVRAGRGPGQAHGAPQRRARAAGSLPLAAVPFAARPSLAAGSAQSRPLADSGSSADGRPARVLRRAARREAVRARRTRGRRPPGRPPPGQSQPGAGGAAGHWRAAPGRRRRPGRQFFPGLAGRRRAAAAAGVTGQIESEPVPARDRARGPSRR